MKVAKLLLITLLAATASYALTIYRKATEAQAATRTAPQIDTPTTGEFLNLDGVEKVRLTLCSCTTSACTTFPDPGPTVASHNPWLTGGNVDIYYKSSATGTYIENKGLKQTVPVADGGCVIFPDFESPGGNPPGTGIFAATNGVTQVYSDAGNYFKVILEGMAQ